MTPSSALGDFERQMCVGQGISRSPEVPESNLAKHGEGIETSLREGSQCWTRRKPFRAHEPSGIFFDPFSQGEATSASPEASFPT